MYYKYSVFPIAERADRRAHSELGEYFNLEEATYIRKEEMGSPTCIASFGDQCAHGYYFVSFTSTVETILCALNSL